MFNRKPTRKILKSKNTMEKSTISKVSDKDQGIFDAMKAMKDKPGLTPMGLLSLWGTFFPFGLKS